MTAKKNSAYWEKRIAAGTWKTYNSLEEKNRDLLEFYTDASEQIKKELYLIAEKYSKDGVLSLSDMHKQNRLTALNRKFQDIIEDLGQKTEKSAKKNMQDGFKAVYENTAVGMGDEDFSMPNKKLMEKLLNEPWRGDSFSGRLWKNQKKLAVGLNDLLLTGLQQGKTATEIAVSLHNFMGQGFNECHRLVRTETMHYLNDATLRRYKDAGVEYVQIWAAEDERTCDECSKYHGKIYPIDKCPHIPFHPNCRCTIIPCFDEKLISEYEKKHGGKKAVAKSQNADIIKDKDKLFEGKSYKVSLKSEESQICKDSIETAVLLNESGNVIYRKSSGATNYVQFTAEELKKMKGMSLTHNHPSNSTFSAEDIELLVSRELKVIRATGVDKTYQLKQISEANKEFSVAFKKAMKSNKKITDKDYKIIQKQLKDNVIDYTEYQNKCSNLNKRLNTLNSNWLKENAKTYGYKYSVIERRR